MRYGRRRIGPTFGEKVGRLISAAITAGNRDDFEGYRRARAGIDEMLDLVAEEAGFAKQFGPEPEDVGEISEQEEASEAGRTAEESARKAKPDQDS